MKKFALVLGALLLLLPFVATAQTVLQQDNFSSMSGWQVGSSTWAAQGGRLVQSDAQAPMARIDRALNQGGSYQISFNVQYVGGGYMNQMDLQNMSFHGGFGIHIGVDQADLGNVSWGNGKSYLLWLNLDTRPQTAKNYPQHYGFRAQVYESTSNSVMDLVPGLNVDIPAALGISLQDLLNYVQSVGLTTIVPIKIQVNTNTGRIMVQDPTAPTLWYYFDLPASKLAGKYISFRTNSLAVSFGNFVVTAQ
ncbi:MAG TPA: hypothetical protein VMW87_16895 [Spirochaetia bacterium]|nr:hypothetical protein [Spirochaetia bacterium]